MAELRDMAADWREGLRPRWDCRSPRQICARAQGLAEAVLSG